MPVALPNTTHAEPAFVRLLGSAERAPTTTSASPSPFTSPAPDTASPALSFAFAPSMRKPPAPSAVRSTRPSLARPNTTNADPDSDRPWKASGRAHDDVGQPVAVDVARRRDRGPRGRAGLDAVELDVRLVEQVDAALLLRQRRGGRRRKREAEHRRRDDGEARRARAPGGAAAPSMSAHHDKLGRRGRPTGHSSTSRG